jgi:putative IMPACT (imprinted ancient) family translation regulator
MLEVISNSGIRNIAVVVTRYFGGVLLGTGGLVRAYQGAVKEALELCQSARQCYGVRLRIKIDYGMVGKLQYILANRNINIEASLYATDVEFTALVPMGEYDSLCGEITEVTGAKAVLEEIERTYFFDKTGC